VGRTLLSVAFDLDVDVDFDLNGGTSTAASTTVEERRFQRRVNATQK